MALGRWNAAANAVQKIAGSGVTDRSTSVGDLAALLNAHLIGDASVEVRGVTHDSRRVTPGSLYCCVEGAIHDGHDFVADAIALGAVAVICSRQLPNLSIPQLLVPDVRSQMGAAAAMIFGDPSKRLNVVGVTGTNGKTTVVSLVSGVLASAGRNVGIIGTLTGARTTPEAPDLQAQLAAFVADGATDVAMEVSSHALALGRVEGTDFAVGVFTNLGSDHLDFHGTAEQYFAAKALLFEPGRCCAGVVNRDDVHGRLLIDATEQPLHGVSIEDLSDVVVGPSGSSFNWRGERVTLPLPGRHNVTNAVLAAEACMLLGIPADEVAQGLSAAAVVPGRFELVERGQKFTVAIDYAHTPDALAAVLTAARELAGANGRVLVVFGCGGDRDRSKRPEMGAVACELSDRAVLTTDNPRSEDATEIAREVVAGCAPDTQNSAGPLRQVADRREAIAVALGEARSGDVVIIAGKGHETTQIVGESVTPFDDRLVAAEELGRLGFVSDSNASASGGVS